MFLDGGDYTATIYQAGSFDIITTKGTVGLTRLSYQTRGNFYF